GGWRLGSRLPPRGRGARCRLFSPATGCRPASTACTRVGTRGTVAGRIPMRNFLLTTCMGAVAVFAMGAAHANDELIRMSQNPKDWVMPTGDYANQRYSKLQQITADNVGKHH